MLAQILSFPNLVAAWRQVESNQGAPGVDAITLKRWGRHWETNLTRLAAQVRANTYRPNRPRRFRVIKKDGTWRELAILTVTDRVLQRAVLNVLEPVFERRFLNCSFGYRPQRSAANAITAVVRVRDRGWPWLLDADILGCFDHLDHALILKLIAPHVPDTVVRNLVVAWLRAGVRRGLSVGTPMGAVLSPLWCNVVLHELDAALQGPDRRLVRYADDFVVLTRSEADAWRARDEVERILTDLRLSLHETKTQVTSFTAGFTFLGVRFRGDRCDYVCRGKRLSVSGPATRLFYDFPPQFY